MKRLLQSAVAFGWWCALVLLLAGCGAPLPAPTPLPTSRVSTRPPVPATATSIPPTATRVPAPTATPVPPPPLLAYTRFNTNKGLQFGVRVYVMKPDGSAQTEVTEGSSAAWSPDGTRLALDCSATSQGLCIVQANGADLRALTTVRGDSHPAWSPDGTRIVFVSKRDGHEQIYVLQADGSQLTRLTNNKARDTDPTWSPDGQKIAFTSDREGGRQIFVMNADGSQPINLTKNQAAMTSNGHPAWSPDGREIAFQGVSKNSLWEQVYVMNRDGSGQRALTKDESNNSRPAWSPDGKRIAFDSTRDVAEHDKRMLNDWPQLYIMQADGSGQTRLTSEPNVYCSEAGWRPGANALALGPTPVPTRRDAATITPARAAGNPTTARGSDSLSDPAALVTQALERQSSKAYRGAISGGQLPDTFEFVPPDRYHITSGDTEVILLGNTDAFSKTQGRWAKIESGWAALMLLPVITGVGLADKITAASLESSETLNGETMRIVSYQGQLKVEGAAEPYSNPVQYRMWIGADGLPHQVTFQAKGQPLGKTTIEYNPSIQIVAPPLP